MFGSLRSQLLLILLPLSAVSLGCCALLGLDLVRLESEVRSFRGRSLTAVHAERFARDLEVTLADAFDRVVHPGDGSGAGGARALDDGLEASRRALHASYTQLRPLLEREHGSDVDARWHEGLIEELESVAAAVESQSRRAVSLAAAGQTAEARRLLSEDLEALVRTRAGERIDPLVRRELRDSEHFGERLVRAEHWLIRSALGSELGGELLPAVYESVLSARFGVFAYREYKAYAHAIHNGATIDAAQLQTLHESAAGALGQLGTLQARGAGAVSDSFTELEAAYTRIQGEYASIRAFARAGLVGQAGAALVPLRGLLDEYVLASTASAGPSSLVHFDRLEAVAASIRRWAMGAGAFAVALVIATFLGASRRMAAPIGRLAQAVQKLHRGEEGWRSGLDLRRRDEVGLIARSFAKLAGELGEARRKVRTLSYYDNVTGLPNRDLFLERLERSLLTARLQSQTMGVLTIGLDAFQQVNDTLGHTAGDELLRQIAERLGRSVRVRDIVGHPRQDDPGHEVSRLGGSQFTILINRLSDAQDAAMIAERVLSELSRAFSVEGSEVNGRANVGIAIFPLDGADAEALLGNANAALKHARELEPSTYQFYSEAMNARASRKLRIGARLRGVLERGDLELHFQPFFDTQTGDIGGAEALLRWTDEELGPVPPSEFIPLAEETGLIVPMGAWVLRRACEQARRWQDRGFRPIRIAVNVSAYQLRRLVWPELLAEVLRETGISADHIEIEITESAILVDDAATLSSLAGVQELGVGISLDDFGTGYSSLSYLRRFPITRVKIDRSFVAEIVADSDGTELTAAILAMAQSLGLGVIAEGIETEEQARYLTERGCQELQGYLISRPVPAAEFERFLVREKTDETDETDDSLDLSEA